VCDDTILDEPVKIRRGVMPANAGIQNPLKILDPGFRRDDGKSEFRTFYQTAILCRLAFSESLLFTCKSFLLRDIVYLQSTSRCRPIHVVVHRVRLQDEDSMRVGSVGSGGEIGHTLNSAGFLNL
jgi:hypothetical protein